MSEIRLRFIGAAGVVVLAVGEGLILSGAPQLHFPLA
jgi:hypothetical protein